MRKRIIDKIQPLDMNPDQDWLDVTDMVEVEITSEDALHPIELALLGKSNSGWRAASPGSQTIRLIFSAPQEIKHILLEFVETHLQRTQEYVLRWSPNGGQSFQEIVRQQWNFNPSGSTSEIENHNVQLSGVTVLELIIIPDISGNDALASVMQFRIA